MEYGFVCMGSLVLCCLDVFMLCLFFQSMFVRRIEKSKFVRNFIIMTLVIFLINFARISLLNFFALPVAVFLFAFLTFQMSVRKGIVYTLIYYIVFCCGKEMAFEMLYRLTAEIFPKLNTDLSSVSGTILLLAEYTLSLFFLLYIRKYTAKIEIGEDSQADWYLLIMPMASVMILFSFVFMDFPDERSIQILMCGSAFFLYFSNAAIFIILAHFTKAMNQAKKAELSLLKMDMEKSNFENIEEINQIYRRYMHDIHRYFFQFRSLALAGENEKIVTIVDGWENGLSKEEKGRLYTGSPVLNSILAQYVNKAEENGAAVTVSVEESIKVDFIQDVDKISLFGNLLENAVEAVAKCREGSRKISIEMFMGNEFILIFQIRNTWARELKTEGKRLLSIKKDAKNHGLGIGIAKDLARRYGGMLELEAQGEWFVTTLMVSKGPKH